MEICAAFMITDVFANVFRILGIETPARAVGDV